VAIRNTVNGPGAYKKYAASILQVLKANVPTGMKHGRFNVMLEN
jgi:hypothetical protein